MYRQSKGLRKLVYPEDVFTLSSSEPLLFMKTHPLSFIQTFHTDTISIGPNQIQT